ncbi:DeoR/GlpR family DNA-binding transcription regulator [Opitutales bacterium ASA1]|uniref:DeoR/GlpR family DNA-binding transcription regulator n=1 Tax=Congregicoccus parvus TaxID=3081749 RepID=UPI002B293A1C|nr:DeoR/GlpR family DNA-binding transcription regulator [Opitutales bacterium ASA1]
MRVPAHIVEERRRQLRELVRRDGFIPVAEICERFGVSIATARRDLAAIENDGHITRTYGGALADYNTSFASIGERDRMARSAKSIIAAAAERKTPRDGTVYLDAGTTVLALARLLAGRTSRQQLTVVTNSLAVATVLGGAPGITLHLIGGVFLHRQSVLFGEQSIEALRNWRFDAAFLGGQSLDATGIWNSHAEIVDLQRAVIEHSTTAFFCLDATKLGRSTPHLVTRWPDAGMLVTDATREQLRAQQVPLAQVVLAR